MSFGVLKLRLLYSSPEDKVNRNGCRILDSLRRSAAWLFGRHQSCAWCRVNLVSYKPEATAARQSGFSLFLTGMWITLPSASKSQRSCLLPMRTVMSRLL